MKNTRGSEWNKWDLHIHTASSYDSPYKADDADELLCPRHLYQVQQGLWRRCPAHELAGL
jgi:hypothetical protein